MENYSQYNAENILNNVNRLITELENANSRRGEEDFYERFKAVKHNWRTNIHNYAFKTTEVCDELSIFDWWNDTLSVSQLKQMKAFLQTAIKLGFKGYVCFKVGATGCSHGMWAHTTETTNGFSPDSDCIFHSFRCGDNYWSVCKDGEWSNDCTLAEVKKILA